MLLLLNVVVAEGATRRRWHWWGILKVITEGARKIPVEFVLWLDNLGKNGENKKKSVEGVKEKGLRSDKI